MSSPTLIVYVSNASSPYLHSNIPRSFTFGISTVRDSHVAKRLQLPKNLLLLFQPSHCPELNPIERLWLHLKDAVRWELFADLEVLRTTLRQRLAQLTQEVVKSLTGWNYILDALFVAGIS